jgi:hypothetical protein
LGSAGTLAAALTCCGVFTPCSRRHSGGRGSRGLAPIESGVPLLLPKQQFTDASDDAAPTSIYAALMGANHMLKVGSFRSSHETDVHAGL